MRGAGLSAPAEVRFGGRSWATRIRMDETGAEQPQQSELPYPMAKRLRDQGLSDARILGELQRTGMSTADAQFVIDSLPGGALERGASELSSGDGNASGQSGGFPMTGFIMIAAGLLIT